MEELCIATGEEVILGCGDVEDRPQAGFGGRERGELLIAWVVYLGSGDQLVEKPLAFGTLHKLEDHVALVTLAGIVVQIAIELVGQHPPE